MEITELLAFMVCRKRIISDTKESLIKENEEFEKNNNKEIIENNLRELHRASLEINIIDFLESYIQKINKSFGYPEINLDEVIFQKRVEEMYSEITTKKCDTRIYD